MKNTPDHSTRARLDTSNSGLFRAERLPTRLVQLGAVLLVLKILALWAFAQFPLVGDEKNYVRLSETFFETFSLKLNCWAPFQTGFLAVIRTFAGDHFIEVGRAVQLGVHTATGGLLFLLTRRVFGIQTAFVTGLIFLTLPEVVSMSYLLFSETWSMFWMVAAITCLFRALPEPNPRWLVPSGLCFGLGALTRAINFYFVPLIAVHAIVWTRGPVKRRLKAVGLIVVAALAIVLTHTIKERSAGLTIAACGSRNIWVSQNTFDPPCRDYECGSSFSKEKKAGFPNARPKASVKGASTRQRAELLGAFVFIAENPSLSLRRSLTKIRRTFAPVLSIYRNINRAPEDSDFARAFDHSIVRGVLSASYMLFMISALIGLVACTERRLWSLTLMLIGFHVTVVAFFFGQSRFRMAITPMLVIFAAWALCHPKEVAACLRSRRSWWIIGVGGLLVVTWIPAFLKIL